MENLEYAQLVTKMLEEEISLGQTYIRKIRRENRDNLTLLKVELEKQKELYLQLNQIKKDLKDERVINDEYKMKRNEYKKINNRITQHIQKNNIIENDFVKLQASLVDKRIPFAKSSAVLVHCARVFIDTINKNEFDDYIWRSTVAKSDHQVGMRIRFEKLNISKNDLVTIYKPIIRNLSQLFKKYNIQISAKTRSSHSYISGLELTCKVKVEKVVESHITASL